MADVATVLDSSGVAGLHVGKNGRKGAAGSLDPASFLSTFLSQVAVAGSAKGKGVHAAGLVASGAVADKALSAKQGSKAEGAEASESARDGKAELVARLARDADGKDEGKDAATATTGVDPALPPAADASASTEAAPENSVNAALAAAQAANGSVDKPAAGPFSEDADKVDVALTKSGPRETAARVPGSTSRGATTASDADKAGDEGQNLPVSVSDKPPESAAVSVSDVATKDVSAMPSRIGANGTQPSSEAAGARGFDQSLRQVETRVNLAVEAPVKSPAFAGELAEKVVWMAGRQGQVAELTLNPPHLGSVEIRLTVSGGDAGAQFFSANPAVRDAIEAALPKLRELMTQAGLNLGEASVRDQALNQERSGEQAGTRSSGFFSEPEGKVSGMLGGTPRSAGVGLVDLYA